MGKNKQKNQMKSCNTVATGNRDKIRKYKKRWNRRQENKRMEKTRDENRIE